MAEKCKPSLSPDQPALSRTIPISLLGCADDVIDFPAPAPAPAHNRT
jgi:hypothetical protein